MIEFEEDGCCIVTHFSDVDGPTKQIVSQPAFGHQVRYLSNSTSVKGRRKKLSKMIQAVPDGQNSYLDLIDIGDV